MLNALDHQLRDAVPDSDLIVVFRVKVDQQHLDLSAIARVDESRGVQAGDTVTEREPTSGLDEASESFWQGHLDPGANEGPSAARCQRDRFGGHKVASRIERMGIGRQRHIVTEPFDGDLDHGPRVPLDPRSLPATDLGSGGMLAWIDLEMTGLEPTRHVIVEIASIVTDDDLTIVAEGPDLVLHVTEAELAEMDPHVVGMHTASGLLEQIHASNLTRADAEAATLAFLAEHLGTADRVPLAGNSIGTDRRFLAAQMPEVENFFHYRCVDVSTLKELARRWNPKVAKGAPGKKGTHRALDDIRESIAELRYYRDTFLRGPDA